MLPGGISWYCPQTMFPPGNRSPQAVLRLTACLLLAAGSGCGSVFPWFRGEDGPLHPVKVAELRPGCYCEIDMNVPPSAVDGSFDCYKGIVKEINHDEVVLSDVVEERCVEFGATAQRRPLKQQNHDLVHVPLTGVASIWALPPAKDAATAKPSSKAVDPKLPSSGAQAKLPRPRQLRVGGRLRESARCEPFFFAVPAASSGPFRYPRQLRATSRDSIRSCCLTWKPFNRSSSRWSSFPPTACSAWPSTIASLRWPTAAG